MWELFSHTKSVQLTIKTFAVFGPDKHCQLLSDDL